MKLYSTVTSERASKGQGGNNFIDVFINDEAGAMLARLNLKLSTDNVGPLLTAAIDFREDVYVNGKHWLDAEVQDKDYKGVSQKDEKCEYCGEHKHAWIQNGVCEGEDARPVYLCSCGAEKDCDGGITGE